MGFKQPDLTDAYSAIRRCLGEVHSPYNDGWASIGCKQDLYQLKCFLEDSYSQLPKFVGEEEWEKQRLIEKLKQK